MKFKVGDKIRAEVNGEDLVGVIKEIDSDFKPYLVYFYGWTGGTQWKWCLQRKVRRIPLLVV